MLVHTPETLPSTSILSIHMIHINELVGVICVITRLRLGCVLASEAMCYQIRSISSTVRSLKLKLVNQWLMVLYSLM